MWPDRRICDLFGIEHPILLAPMAGVSTPALAAAVANAGGLGSLGCAMLAPEALAEAVAGVRARTNAPFMLNFFAHPAAAQDTGVVARFGELLAPWYARFGLGAPPAMVPDAEPGFPAARLEELLALAPAVASFHFGLPEPGVVEGLKAAGIRVVATATTVAEARALAAAGVDAVVAQGWEAGGHRGAHRPTAPGDGVGTMALVPQVVDAVELPVIAAGGIADGRGVAAALALGAAGVQLGTAFLLCPEAATDPGRRAHLAAAADDDTIMVAAVSGRPARARRSRYGAEMAAAGAEVPAFPALYAATRPLLEAAAGADDEVSFHLYGQAAALARQAPAAEVFAALVDGAQAAMARLGRG